MNIAIIVAIAEGNAIGKDQELLCHMPADLKRFKALSNDKQADIKRGFESKRGSARKGRK